MENTKIYECRIEKHPARFWKIFRSYLFFYSISIIMLIYCDSKNRSLITEFCVLALIFFLVAKYCEVKKWTRIKVEKIEMKSEAVELQIIERDERKRIVIPLKNLRNRLKWTGSRPKILELKILNIEDEILTIYSAGKHEIECELENIAYSLNKVAKSGSISYVQNA